MPYLTKNFRTDLAGLAVIGVLWLLPFSRALAQEEDGLEDEFRLLEEEQLVYSAAKHQQDIAESPSAITVIAREQIENSTCRSIICLLQRVPELDVYISNPMTTTLSCRALSRGLGNRILALVDGREINSETFGSPIWEALPIHLEDIERIEVIRGPSSALYGANAFSAVVSITSRKTTRDGAVAFVGFGENRYSNFHLRLDKLLGEWRLQLSGSQISMGGYDDPRLLELSAYLFRVRLERETATSTSTLELGLSTPTGQLYTDLNLLEVRDAQNAYARLRHRQGFLTAQFNLSLTHSGMAMNTPLFYGGLKLGELPKNLSFVTGVADADVLGSWNLLQDTFLLVGANYRFGLFQSAQSTPALATQHRVGAFAHAEQRLFTHLLLSGGLRLDYNSTTKFAMSPQVALIWHLGANQLRLAFGQAFLVPTFLQTSLHVNNVKESVTGIQKFFEQGIGNDQLKNERTTVWEIGYRGTFFSNRLVVEGGVFYNLYRDAISYSYHIEMNNLGLPDLNKSYMYYSNQDLEADTVGGSIALNYRPMERLVLFASYNYRYSFYRTDPLSIPGLHQGDQVPFEPAHVFSVSGQYQSARGMKLALGIFGMSSILGNVNKDGSIFGERIYAWIPVRWQADALISWRFELGQLELEAGLRASNVFNLPFPYGRSALMPDGSRFGHESLGREIMSFLRGSLQKGPGD